MINIAIADPAYLVREGLKSIINRNKELVLKEEIKNRGEFWNKLNSSRPDILVVDYDYNNFIQVEEIIDVSQKFPDTSTVVISSHTNKENIIKVVRSGVLAYLTKECGGDEILKAIQSASAGEKFYCQKILDVIVENNSSSQLFKEEGLSKREIEIVKLVAEGYSNQDIAEKLFLSIHTVYTHRKNIMKKLRLKSPVELVLYALNSGIAGG